MGYDCQQSEIHDIQNWNASLQWPYLLIFTITQSRGLIGRLCVAKRLPPARIEFVCAAVTPHSSRFLGLVSMHEFINSNTLRATTRCTDHYTKRAKKSGESDIVRNLNNSISIDFPPPETEKRLPGTRASSPKTGN